MQLGMAAPPPGYGGYPPPPPCQVYAPPPGQESHREGSPPREEVAPYHAPPPGGYGPPPPGAYCYPPPPPVGYGPPPPHYGYPPPHPGAYGAPPPGPYGYPPPPAYGYPPPPGYPPYGYPPPPGYPPYGYPPPPGVYVGTGGGGYYGDRGSSRSRSPRGGRGSEGKHTCRFFIGIENDDDFRVARRIIGANGNKMKEIVAKSGGDAKLRLRGKGSGYVERDSNHESPEPLQLCISCPTHEGYIMARRCTEELLIRVYGEYDSWCADKGRPHRSPGIHMTERHHESAGGQQQSRQESPGTNRGRGGGRRGGGGKARKSSSAPPSGHNGGGEGGGGPEDRGTPPANAPPEQEIEKLVNDRNEARRRGDFSKADSIRDNLKNKGVVLSDEKGGHGNGLMVTQWRYWHD